jgi:hypothetical protein
MTITSSSIVRITRYCPRAVTPGPDVCDSFHDLLERLFRERFGVVCYIQEAVERLVILSRGCTFTVSGRALISGRSWIVVTIEGYWLQWSMKAAPRKGEMFRMATPTMTAVTAR